MGYNDAGIYTFKGVPYAKAERFMPPQAPDSWEGVRKTLVYGPQAMQSQDMIWHGAPSDYDFGFQFKKELNSEDCQVLNIWTPALDGGKRPVFVWIHGGGYANGSAIFLPAQEGRALAEKGDIVVVTVNHRLNILGYIDLTALGGKYSESVNLGQQDLVKALEWVRDNIAAFGGDPGCVTIGGHVRILGEPEREAEALGIDENAALMVRYEDGSEDRIASGEVSVRGLYGYLNH